MDKFTYTFTSAEDDVLTEMVAFFCDCGMPEGAISNEDAFNSLVDKILMVDELRPSP
tara:strand:+ start:82 stop:252 length:171 start_codon:yes stop_codon:yes gene_type:complete